MIGFIATPIVISYLGKEHYGIWIIIGNVLGYVGLMDFGITGAITTLVAKNNNEKNSHKINGLVNNAFFLQLGILILIICIGSILSFFVPSFFAVDPNDHNLVFKTFLFAIIGYAISFPPKSFKGLIKGRQYISLLAWLEFANVALITLLNISLLYLGFGLLAMPIGAIVIRLLSYFPFFYFAKRAFPELKLSFKLFDRKEAFSILNVSALWFIGTTSAIIIYSTDNIVIGKFISIELVAAYYVTYRLSEFLRDRLYMISKTALPGFGQLLGQGDFKKMQNLYLRSQRIIIGLTIPISFLIVLFNYDFVSLWVGADLFAGQEITIAFAFLLFIMVFYQSSSVVLSSGLQLKAIAWSRGIEASLNLFLSIIGALKFGLFGVIGATIISNLLTSFWYIPLKTRQFLQLTFNDLFKDVYKHIIPVLIINLAILFVFNNYSDMIAPTLLKLFLFGLVNLMIFWYFILDETFKKQVILNTKVLLNKN